MSYFDRLFFNRTNFSTYSFLGKAVATDLPAPIYKAIANYLDKQDCPQLEVYHRASKGSDIFYSTEYKRPLLRNSTVVQYRTDDNTSLYGIIHCFIQCESLRFAVIKDLVPLPDERCPVKSLVLVNLSESYHCINLNNLIFKLVYMDVEDTLYIGIMPNCLKID